MVIFNILKIISGKLIIDVSIDNNFEGDENQTLAQVWIDNQVPLISDNCPVKTSKAVLLASVNDPEYSEDLEKFEYATIIEGDKKSLRLELDSIQDINFESELCHVYVITKDSENCNSVISTLVNFYPVYYQSMFYVKDLLNDCSPHKEFIDLILKIKALEMYIKAGNYTLGHKIWDSIKEYKTFVPNCKCSNYGIIY